MSCRCWSSWEPRCRSCEEKKAIYSHLPLSPPAMIITLVIMTLLIWFSHHTITRVLCAMCLDPAKWTTAAATAAGLKLSHHDEILTARSPLYTRHGRPWFPCFLFNCLYNTWMSIDSFLFLVVYFRRRAHIAHLINYFESKTWCQTERSSAGWKSVRTSPFSL